MISLSDAIGKGSLRSLTSLRFDDNKISDPCMVALSAALSSGSLASLTGLVVNDKEHPQLKAACHQRGLRVHQSAPV